MEQNKYYKQADATIKRLEQQLALCADSSIQCEKSAMEAQKDIEVHFAKIINSLAARKSVLLQEIAQKVQAQKVCMEETHKKLEAAIKGSRQAFEATALLYYVKVDIAEGIWKDVSNVSVPSVHDMRIKVELTNEFLDVIQLHGKVLNSQQLDTLNSHQLDTLNSHQFSIAESVTTFAGSGSTGKVDGTGLNASFYGPLGLCSNANDDCLYVCDSNSSSIRKITTQGVVTTFVSGLITPTALTLNPVERIYYVASSGGNNILKITSTGASSVFAGNGTAAHVDGAGKTASFNYPRGIAIDQKTSVVFVSDWDNHAIRKITPQGEVSTLAGSPGSKGFADGNGRAAKFTYPWGIWYDDQSQSLLVCDYSNQKLRRVQLNGDVSTVCNVQTPTAVVVTANGTILVSSRGGNKIFKITQKGHKYEAEILAGSGKGERVDGTPDKCGFHHPIGIAVHEPSQSCFVSDNDSNTIRKISFA